MFALLSLLPRWLIVSGLLFLFGFEVGQITAHRELGGELAQLRAQLSARERAGRASTSTPALARTSPRAR